MTIAFIGAGNMAGSLIRGLQAGGYSAYDIVAADPARSQLDALATLGISTTENNAQAVAQAEIVVLAIKPRSQVMFYSTRIWLISWLSQSLQASIPVALATGCQTTAVMRCRCYWLCWGRHYWSATQVFDIQRNKAEAILNGVGNGVWIGESQLDAVTAVSDAVRAFC